MLFRLPGLWRALVLALACVALFAMGCALQLPGQGGGGAAPTPSPGSTPGATPALPPLPGGHTVAELEAKVFQLVNQARAAEGVPALTLAADLSAIARAHSEDMARRGYFSHENPEGQRVQQRIESAGIMTAAVGENIHKNANQSTPAEEAVQSWLASPPHRATMMSTVVDETGVGVAFGADGYFYFTQVFIKRMAQFTEEQLAQEQASVVDLINERRRAAGVPDLSLAEDISAISLAHSEDMAQRGYLSPVTPEGQTPDQRLAQAGISAGYPYEWVWKFFTNGPVASVIVDKMFERETTRKALLSSVCDEAGVGLYQHTDGFIYVTVTLIERR